MGKVTLYVRVENEKAFKKIKKPSELFNQAVLVEADRLKEEKRLRQLEKQVA